MALKLRLIPPTFKLVLRHLIYLPQQSNDELAVVVESRNMAQYLILNQGKLLDFFQKLKIPNKYSQLKCMRSKGLIWLMGLVRIIASRYFHFYKIHSHSKLFQYPHDLMS